MIACFLATAVSSGQTTESTRHGSVTTSDGIRLHYVEAGSGPSLLFVPGWTSFAGLWERQIRYFSARYRVVAMDPRSQGESEQATEGHYPERRALDIRELIEQLNLAPVVVVGHSMAVGELLAYVDQFGTTNLAGLVLVDGVIGADPGVAQLAQFTEQMRVLSVDRKAVLDGMVDQFFTTPLTPEYRQRLVDNSMKTPTNTALALFAASVLRDHRPALAKIDKPLLYAVTPALASQAELVEARVPAARIEVFEKSGHVLFVDEEARFNEVLDDFARTALSAARSE